MSGMPAFDGGGVGWITVPTIGNGWTTTGSYQIRGGMCTLVVSATKATWSAEVMFNMPIGARPSIQIYFYAASANTAGTGPMYIHPSGSVACVFGSATSGGGGLLGTITYPVG